MKKFKFFLYRSFISLLIFWGMQMILYIITTLLAGARQETIFPDIMTEMINGLFILSFITFGYLGWLNVFFLWMLYFTKINRIWMRSKWICVIESTLFWIIFYVLGMVIDYLPDNIKFYYTPPTVESGNAVSEAAYTFHPCFSDDAKILYVYIVLFLIAVLTKLYKRKDTDKLFFM